MPWAHDEPRSLDEKVELLRVFRGNFDLGKDFVYGIFSADESMALGGTGLHTRVGEGAFEIGYWVRSSHVGQGIATTAAAALTKVGIELGGADRIEIHVDPANERSCRIPRRLGYREEGTLRRRLPTGAGAPRRDAVVFSLLAEELAGSPAAATQLRAFDARGLDDRLARSSDLEQVRDHHVVAADREVVGVGELLDTRDLLGVRLEDLAEREEAVVDDSGLETVRRRGALPS